MNTMKIVGSFGSFEICANSGKIVTAYSQIPRAYQEYSSADVAEYKRWCESNELDPNADVPILCIGLCRFDGKAHAPEVVWREEVVSHLRDEQRQPLAA